MYLIDKHKINWCSKYLIIGITIDTYNNLFELIFLHYSLPHDRSIWSCFIGCQIFFHKCFFCFRWINSWLHPPSICFLQSFSRLNIKLFLYKYLIKRLPLFLRFWCCCINLLLYRFFLVKYLHSTIELLV